METLTAHIPAKKRLDIADDLGNEGVQAELTDADAGGRMCHIRITGGAKDARTTLERVLRSHGVTLETSDEDA